MISVNGKQHEFEGVVFLDIDGVLNSAKWFRSPEYHKRLSNNSVDFHRKEMDIEFSRAYQYVHIDPSALSLFNKLLCKFNLAIVICSTWRNYEFSRKALELAGIHNYSERLLGFTPWLKNARRGYEVIDWMVMNSFKGEFYILDDEGGYDVILNGINLADRQVQPHYHGAGFTEHEYALFEQLVHKDLNGA